MTKEAMEKIALEAEKVYELRMKKKAIEEKLAVYENDLKADIADQDAPNGVYGGYFVKMTEVAATRTVDTVALKAAGLYDKYSKVKPGYKKLSVDKA